MSSSTPTKTNKQNSELKKELSETTARLAALASRFEQYNAIINQSQDILASDKRQKGQVSALEQRIKDLEELDRQNTEAFALSALRLTEQYRTSLAEAQAQHDLQLQEELKKCHREVNDIRRQTNSDQAQIRGLHARENTIRAEADAKLHQLEKEKVAKETELERQLERVRGHLSDMQAREKSLAQELREQQIIMRGRETEKEQLYKKLRDLETFHDFSLEDVRTKIANIERDLQQFCIQCVNHADLHPSWNQLPDVLQKPGLPNLFDRQTDEGTAFVVSVIRDSIINLMRKLVLTDAVVCTCSQAQKMSEALYQQSASRHAAWRSLVVRAVSENRSIEESLLSTLEQAANELLRSWKLFPSHIEQNMQNKLSQLLGSTQTLWLQMQIFPIRILVDYRADSVLADDKAEPLKTIRMPGEFGNDDMVEPVLCLFPSFWYLPAEKGAQPVLIHEGKAMHKSSPEILTIFQAVQKKRKSQVGSQRSSIVQKVETQDV